ncbi:hypothetical protein [Nonomuraea sp. NPDC005650]|uniref:hypothetical protein n=1 Tax=Nonomuraea sp. NPDC005650 TaxID=3157045 RepID=UPI0033B77679
MRLWRAEDAPARMGTACTRKPGRVSETELRVPLNAERALGCSGRRGQGGVTRVRPTPPWSEQPLSKS